MAKALPMTKCKFFYKHLILPYYIETFVSVNQTDEEFLASIEDSYPIAYSEHGKKWSESVVEPFLEKESASARTVQYASSIIGIRFYDIDFSTLRSFNLVTHEFAHVTSYVFEHINMPHTPDSDEAYAYLMGHLVQNFYTNVTNYGKVQYG